MRFLDQVLQLVDPFLSPFLVSFGVTPGESRTMARSRHAFFSDSLLTIPMNRLFARDLNFKALASRR